jgi:N-acetylneuraminic acid mutarotase
MPKEKGSAERANASGERGRLLSIISVLVFLAACGGGGGEDGSSPPPRDPDGPLSNGRGSLEITGSTNATQDDSVFLSGTAFISPTRFRCCSGSATDTAVEVSWRTSAGASGVANQSVGLCSFFGFGVFLCNHTWSASIPLSTGENRVTVTARDEDGNVGQDAVTITRLPDTTPPRVSSTAPLDAAGNVSVNASIFIQFNEAMDPTSVSHGAITLQDSGGNLVGGTVSPSNPRGAIFDPSASLAAMTTYTATVGAGLRDAVGNAMVAPHVWSFTTGLVPDTTRPTVVSTSPPTDSTCAGPDTRLTATFSESINSTTVNTGTFTVTQGGNTVFGTISAPSSTSFTFAPNSGLGYSTAYTATLTTQIRDLAGNSLSANHVWNFTTVPTGIGSWQATAETILPPRAGHTAIWTGTEMIIWGGFTQFFGSQLPYTASGHRYNPVADTWTEVSSVGAPSARDNHVAVWTGNEMIIWGGVGSVVHFDGARYRPGSNTWQPISSVLAPAESLSNSAVWSGAEMLVWSGGVGGRYDPASDSWLRLPAPAIARAAGHTAVWTGSRMIVWGGHPSLAVDVGAMYDPATDAWQTISNSNAPSGRNGHTAVWTGTEMIVWGGSGGSPSALRSTGGAYNPFTDTWRSISVCGSSEKAGHTAIWTGTEMIIWGGTASSTGQLYDPVADAWRHASIVNVPQRRRRHTAVWTGSSMIIWGGDVPPTEFRSGGRYTP